MAYDMLHAEGLTRYYDLSCGIVNPGAEDAGPMTWLGPLVARARDLSRDGRLSVTVDVQGLHCAGCVWVIQTLFQRRDGAVHIGVNPGVGRIELVFDPERFDVAAYLGDLAHLGYRSGPPLKASRGESDGLSVRLGVTIALAMNVMILSAAGYLGLNAEEEPGLFSLFGWLAFALTTVSVLVGGPVFFRGAWGALRRRALHLDVPIAIGIALAWGGSTWLFFEGGGDQAYFDTLAIFIALMLLGRYLQSRFVERNRRMLLADAGLSGLHVRVIAPDDTLALAPVDEVLCGTRLLVTPGELVPVDARVVGGAADFSLAWIDGESDPVAFVGERVVPAGAHLVGGVARELVATQGFSDSALHTLLAPGSRGGDAPDGFWHRVSSAYVLLVLGFAALALALWWSDSPARAFEVAIAVLVVTCPCAIGLATPLAYEIVHARLRKKGLFVRESGFLDKVRRVRQVFFDKTGTLTLGELTLADPAALDGLPPAARAALFQMTVRSSHPKSRALFTHLGRRGGATLDPGAAVTEEPGVGLTLRSAEGSWRLVADADVDADGERALLLERDGVVLARFAFVETLRHDVATEVAALGHAGVDVWLLSGDAEARVHAAARALAIPAERTRAACRPADKAAVIRAADRHDSLMIGDGINDAPAFEAALCAGTPAVDRPTLPARADFYLMASGIGPISEAIALGGRLRRTVVRNLAFAAAYNLAGVALALAGLLSPLVCAVAMPLSSLSVLALTLFSLREHAPARVATAHAVALPDARGVTR
ncbi:MAG: ATPase P [Deltaproteobacteria bacterium HGW-Deltaproteobacteria-14]|nr:MAG: ATPase P [Deltaproteobacteria bacterium HGW-Deltaproteobacteria-14]